MTRREAVATSAGRLPYSFRNSISKPLSLLYFILWASLPSICETDRKNWFPDPSESPFEEVRGRL
jgi:hypothetical protein